MRPIVLVLAMLATVGLANAQEFPSRPITMLIGLAPGGVSDLMGRIYADAVSRISGQKVVVENRPAASGAVAASALQNAAPDGYTLLLFSIAQHATIPAMSETAPYDPINGMQQITKLFNVATVVVVPVESPVKSISDLQAFAQQKSAGLTFGSPGVGTPSHLLGANIMGALGIHAEYAHYRGGAPMMADLLSGRLDVAVLSTPLARPYLLEKKLRALALDAPARWSAIPETPTLTELGLGAATVPGWFGIGSAPNTPKPIVDRLHTFFIAAAKDQTVLDRIAANGLTVVTSGPGETRTEMVAENQKIGVLVQKLGLRKQ